jgi:hypothetical protein
VTIAACWPCLRISAPRSSAGLPTHAPTTNLRDRIEVGGQPVVVRTIEPLPGDFRKASRAWSSTYARWQRKARAELSEAQLRQSRGACRLYAPDHIGVETPGTAFVNEGVNPDQRACSRVSVAPCETEREIQVVPAGARLRHRVSTIANQDGDLQVVPGSPLPDYSNRRPPPYHGGQGVWPRMARVGGKWL